MDGEGDVLKHDQGVRDRDARQEEVDRQEVEGQRVNVFYSLLFRAQNITIVFSDFCHTCLIVKKLEFQKMPFHPWDWIAHITMSEHKNIEDVEEDAENADYHRKVNVNCVVEVLPSSNINVDE